MQPTGSDRRRSERLCQWSAIRPITASVWSNYLFALPAIVLGIFVGLKIDRRINPIVFRKIVLVLLIVMGLRLILGSIT